MGGGVLALVLLVWWMRMAETDRALLTVWGSSSFHTLTFGTTAVVSCIERVTHVKLPKRITGVHVYLAA